MNVLNPKKVKSNSSCPVLASSCGVPVISSSQNVASIALSASEDEISRLKEAKRKGKRGSLSKSQSATSTRKITLAHLDVRDIKKNQYISSKVCTSRKILFF